MKIPKKLMLMGQEITVEYESALHFNENCQGLAKYRTGKITLQPSTEQTPLTQNMLEHNFCHELIHHILYMAGEDQFEPGLHTREFLIDRIAGLLHQALTTAEYET